MQIHELPDVTAIGSGGYFATDNGSQTTKIDYDALAKAIIEQYSASTLAGAAQSVKAALDGLNDSFLYFTDTNSASDGDTASDRFKASMIRVLTNFAQTSPKVNRTYPMMCVFSGASSGTLTGTVNVTSSAMRFTMTYNQDTYVGTFIRSSGVINPWYTNPTRTEVDTLQTGLNVVYGANPIKTLAATDDLLTLDVGMYRVANVLPLNAPSTTYKYGYATKQHRGASGYTYYEFVVGNGNGNDFKRYYGWQYSNSATSIDWIEMAPQSAVDALNSKVLGHIGKETLTNSNIYSAYGWITGGKKTLFLIIPLNLTDDLSTATIASLKVGLRLSTGGYAFGADSTDVTSKITKIVVNKREGVLRVEITSDTDICDTNNICCAGTANLTATFS